MKIVPMMNQEKHLIGIRLMPDTPSESFVLQEFLRLTGKAMLAQIGVAGFYVPEYGVSFAPPTDEMLMRRDPVIVGQLRRRPDGLLLTVMVVDESRGTQGMALVSRPRIEEYWENIHAVAAWPVAIHPNPTPPVVETSDHNTEAPSPSES